MLRSLTVLVLIFSANNMIQVLTKPRHVAKTQSKMDNFIAFEYTNMSFMHAESPAWDADTGMLYWVDVLNQDVHELHYGTMQHRSKHIEYGEVNVVLPVANSTRVMVCVRSEVFLLDWSKPGDSALRLISAFDLGKPDNIINEGKADARGRLWAGTKGAQYGDAVMSDEGGLYSLYQPSFTPQTQLKPVSISNGLTWALNNSILYYIDSLTKKIEAFDFDLERGAISKRRTILDITDYGYDDALPDGMTIDRDGYLWVALVFNGSIIRIDPDAGVIVEQYHLPVTKPTSVAWVGETLEVLVVTTSRRNMDADKIASEPLSGAIFALYDIGTGGVPDHKVVFDGADSY